MELTVQEVSIPVMSEEGKVVNSKQYIVTSEDGTSYDGEFHSSADAAQEVIDTAKNDISALEFCKSQYPEMSYKGHKAKQNVIAEFLNWLDAGKPELPDPEVKE